MGLIEFLLAVVVCVLVTAAACWVMDYLAPSHPAIINRGLWVLCVVIVLLMLARDRTTRSRSANPAHPLILRR